MKKNIVFRIYGDRNWIGGVYYKKNIIYSVLQSKVICEKYNIILCVTKENRELFSEFETRVKIKILPKKRIAYELCIFLMMLNAKNKYLYCLNSANYDKFFVGESIQWIPDFQYLYYPEYFNPSEVEHRNINYKKIADKKGKLVLSSYTCKEDFVKEFPNYKTQIYVVPFVSYIEKEIRDITSQFELKVMEKYNLKKNGYIYIPNQFWKHKNHIVVFKAIKILKKNAWREQFPYKFVFTGELKDYRNPDYLEQIKKLCNEKETKDNILNLGFLPRNEQLVIMKNAKILIQPSLFEGWGTVLEDAKVLDKKVILSDIPIHREQKNELCTLFAANNADELAKTIIFVCSENYESNIQKGIKMMQEHAKMYSKELERLFE